MRLVILTVLTASMLLTAGCDSASKQKEQAPQATNAATPQKLGGKREDIGLESDNGSKAVLTYAFAGTAAPKAAFTGADGRDVQLSDFAGRPLLVNVWATWCAPCKVEMPTLDALAAREEGKMSVIKAGPEWEVERQAAFDAMVNATPAILDGRVYVRTHAALYCFGK